MNHKEFRVCTIVGTRQAPRQAHDTVRSLKQSPWAMATRTGAESLGAGNMRADIRPSLRTLARHCNFPNGALAQGNEGGERGWMGLFIRDLDRQDLRALDLPADRRGVVVSGVDDTWETLRREISPLRKRLQDAEA